MALTVLSKRLWLSGMLIELTKGEYIMTYILIAVMFTIGFIILDDNMPDGHA